MTGSPARLANRILLGLLIGLVAGLLTLALGHFKPVVLDMARAVATTVLDPLGQVFLRLLFFVVIPLVFASLASGVNQLGDFSRLGSLAQRTLALFLLNMVVGVALGLAMINLLQPGAQVDPVSRDRLMAAFASDGARHAGVAEAQAPFTAMTVVDMFMPRNLAGTVAGFSRNGLGEVLPLIVFALLVGAAGTRLPPEDRARLQRGLDLVTQLMTGIVDFALRLAPYAVPAMIYSVVVRIGVDFIVALALFVAGVLGVLALHLFGTMALFLKLFSRRSPWRFFRDIPGRC